MMTLEEVWENLRKDQEIKATMEEAEKSYKLFKKIENLIVTDLEAKLAKSEEIQNLCKVPDKELKKLEEYEKQLNLAKMNESFEKEKKDNAFELIDQLKQQLAEKEKALQLACDELDDAKDMLRDAGKNEWASLLNTSADYFKSKAKGKR